MNTTCTTSMTANDFKDRMIRVSTFSIYAKPEHHLVYGSNVNASIVEFNKAQYAVVLTEVTELEPTEYNGPGTDNRCKHGF